MFFHTEPKSDSYLESSCSDCKAESYQKQWTQLLVNWLNTCVNPQGIVKELNLRSLVEIIDKYKEDICATDIDRAILCTDDLEPFLRYKYPLFRLRYLSEEQDIPKKLYLMTSVLLYHCCVSSIGGQVVVDICEKMTKEEREMILKFCERLNEMEITLNNLETAIGDAIEDVLEMVKKAEKQQRLAEEKSKSSESIAKKLSITTSDKSGKKYALQFRSSVTVMASSMSEESSTISQASLPESSEISPFAEKRLSESSDVTSIYTVRKYTTNTTDEFYSDDLERSYKPQISGREKMLYNNKSYKENSMSDCKSTLLGDQPSTTMDEEDVFLAFPDTGMRRAYPDRYSEQSYQSTSFVRSSQENIDKLKGDISETKAVTSDIKVNEPEVEKLNEKELEIENENENLKKKGKDWKCRKLSCGKYQQYMCCAFGLTSLAVTLSVLGLYWSSWKAFILNNTTSANALSETAVRSDVNDTANVTKFVQPRSPDYEPQMTSRTWMWQCKDTVCERVKSSDQTQNFHLSLSRCILLCTGPQIWPQPIAYTSFSKTIIGLATNRMEYKFQNIPSEAVNQHLGEAFKLFLAELARLERVDMQNRKNFTKDFEVKKLTILLNVESDPDPRIRLDTDEAYYLKIETLVSKVKVSITSISFCGVRHGLETLSQLMLLDQVTGFLITLSSLHIKDSPTYKYRGIMIDTGRNYLPVQDLLRTVDAMASCKLNTLHWRVTDSASFPLVIPGLENLARYGAYDSSMVYTEESVRRVVNRASVRGIRVVMEVAMPGPVGRAWSWSEEAVCTKKLDNETCSKDVCIHLRTSNKMFKYLEKIYSHILSLTGVDDVFHLSNGVFSMANCYSLLDSREHFLEKALKVLKLVNKGFLPKLPIVWYTDHLKNELEAKPWEKFGVQLYEWPERTDDSLRHYKLIHSSKWGLSCEMKKNRCYKYRTWQEMYAWKSWRSLDAFSVEGGETILWTDLVDSANLDYHLWPRAAAVAERLWSDIVVNGTATGDVYMRLDSHRWRMLIRGHKVQPIWPVWCSFNPSVCIRNIQNIRR